MKGKKLLWIVLAGSVAGAVNGLFGAGGGMVLVPILSGHTELHEDQVFPCSVSIILPICIASIFANSGMGGLPMREAWPYLFGSVGGGILAAYTGERIPVKWLHRILGLLILWGGIRYLC